MAADGEFLARFEAQQIAERERFRGYLTEQGRLDLLAQYDEKMRLLDLGITSARNAWHSISPAMRRVVVRAADGPLVRVERRGSAYYPVTAGGEAGHERVGARDTVRALAARNLLAWDGTATDPEARVVITERGRFVIQFGCTDAE